jgi:hypothetical protein
VVRTFAEDGGWTPRKTSSSKRGRLKASQHSVRAWPHEEIA